MQVFYKKDLKMGLLSNLLQIRFRSAVAGDLIGTDEFGNTYYQEKLLFTKPQRPLKRWVIYRDAGAEASAVPPRWFSWLHYTSEAPLKEATPAWVKPHTPNTTGTPQAYHPPHSLLHPMPEEKQKKRYQPWTPASFSNKKITIQKDTLDEK
jgi:NADH:ubiquinone oxidoreductase 17.2 kD subunit